MGNEGMIQVYSVLFWVSAAITVLGILSAVLTFILFDIKTLFAVKTGRAEKASLQKLEEKNLETGRLKDDYSFDTRTGTLNRQTKKMAKTTAQMNTASSAPVPETSQLQSNSNGLNSKPAGETTLLQSNKVENGERSSANSHVQQAVFHTIPGFDITENIMIIHTDEVIG